MIRENQPNSSKWQPNKPINATTGAEQTETDYQADQDRPVNACDFPVEGSRDEIEHSVAMPDTRKDDAPGAPLGSVPRSRSDEPTAPAVEGDDRIDHQWRTGDPNSSTH